MCSVLFARAHLPNGRGTDGAVARVSGAPQQLLQHVKDRVDELTFRGIPLVHFVSPCALKSEVVNPTQQLSEAAVVNDSKAILKFIGLTPNKKQSPNRRYAFNSLGETGLTRGFVSWFLFKEKHVTHTHTTSG